MSKVYEFKVEMTCSGCSAAVEKVLSKLSGIENIAFSLEDQLVTVTTDLPADEVLAAIKKTGKVTKFIGVKK